MSQYRVELRGDVREVYIVEADSPEQAREQWAGGFLFLTECSGMDVESVREVYIVEAS